MSNGETWLVDRTSCLCWKMVLLIDGRPGRQVGSVLSYLSEKAVGTRAGGIGAFRAPYNKSTECSGHWRSSRSNLKSRARAERHPCTMHRKPCVAANALRMPATPATPYTVCPRARLQKACCASPLGRYSSPSSQPNSGRLGALVALSADASCRPHTMGCLPLAVD